MQVQQWIREKGWESLTTELGISVKHYPEEGITLLDYSQIDSPKSHPVVIECRGLILYTESLGVACKSFDRFFNYGEVPDFYTDFDWSNISVFEKADGSLIRVWFNHIAKCWEISTRGMAFAEGNHVLGGSFRERVLEAFGFKNERDFQEFMAPCNREVFLVFEFTGPENRHVVRYEKSEMVFLAAFVLDEDQSRGVVEVSSPAAVLRMMMFNLNIRLPKNYSYSSAKDLVDAAASLPNLAEGFVVRCNTTGKRVKIKNPAYVAVHHLRDNGGTPNPKRICTLISMGEEGEYLSYFPEDKKFFEPWIEKEQQIRTDLLNTWAKIYTITDQKTFALEIKGDPLSGLYFEAKKKDLHPVAVFLKLDINKKLKYFGF